MNGTTKYRTTSDSNSVASAPKGADIIYLSERKSDTSTGSATRSVRYQPNFGRADQFNEPRLRKSFGDKISFDQIRKKADQEIIDYSYHLIVDALDSEIDPIERSNLFDEWKDTLNTIIAEVSNANVNHRKILGALIVATKGKDIADIEAEELHILRDATYMLRQLRVTKNDSKRIIKTLIGIGVDMAIPLAVDDMSDKDNKSLHSLMESLIKRSKSH